MLILAERPEVKSQFTTILYQLLLDPSERVCFEAISCVLGKFDASERYIWIIACPYSLFPSLFCSEPTAEVLVCDLFLSICLRLCSLEDRANGWVLLTTAILKFPEPPSLPAKDASGGAGKDSATKEGIPPRGPKDRQAPRPRRPQPLIKLVMRR
jgi:hypothetical protein